ncbi:MULTISPECIES: hypothetical protein [Variovorax]|jgi:hypothetical protein|uniref:hypothetical protein n=2 Tax=Comamonadaceae TaxID=80864 RepID=UPI00086DE117|nr:MULTISPECIES: hypothetical protein [Variovorax]ODU18914.1 MAG: hypothetical protein ABS94_02440 [Variovorax sp. SCN 67-85]MBN8758446.1 hypothetical protein [Variovorax sp.]ODV18609.1 MAG: hypothetical protein ABT25_27925 [Variovorax sp. SCN 67-20]OJZ05906.1 MAG: hypothetical protein BGP22_23775 [Variovorax sp. 67-131]UKI06071.1 hypothetical protein L3V85_25015 [Variovorax paradoxus]
MSQYVFTMSSRMVAITAVCLVLLCVLLFLMGIEIGKLMAPTPAPAAAAVVAPAPQPSSSPSPAPAPAAPTQ